MRLRPLVLTIAIGLTACVGTAVAAAPPIAAYSLAAPRSLAASGLVARAVVPAGAGCPDLVADGRSLRMNLRSAAANTGSAFAPITVCERTVPAGSTRVTVGGTAIPAAMPGRVRRIGIFSDSGCRVKPGDPVQDCSSTEAWPLAGIARRVAGSSPDVVVFTGDFFYREGPCPDGFQDYCGASPPPVPGMPFTDSAYGWIVDVLVPMAPVLHAAPLVVVRGNHEDCWRAGNGYFLLFDPRPTTANWCAPVADGSGALSARAAPPTDPYPIDLPVAKGRTLRLVIADSAPGSDIRVTPEAAVLRPAYSKANDLAVARAGRESWLLVHRPIFGLVSSTLVSGTGTPWTSVDQQAASVGLLSRYRMILSSHIHLAQAVQIPGQAGQLVLGNGGTELDPATGYDMPTYGPLQNAVGTPLITGVPPYPAPVAEWTDVRFGYAMAVPSAAAGRWSIRVRTDAGTLMATCRVAGRTLGCSPA